MDFIPVDKPFTCHS